MAGKSLEQFVSSPWAEFVKWLSAPAEAEIKSLGIADKDEKNAFGHAYTAALIAHGYLGMPISRGRSADAADVVDVLGRAKENLPGIFGRQTDFRDYYRDLWNNGVGADIGNYAEARHLPPTAEPLAHFSRHHSGRPGPANAAAGSRGAAWDIQRQTDVVRSSSALGTAGQFRRP